MAYIKWTFVVEGGLRLAGKAVETHMSVLQWNPNPPGVASVTQKMKFAHTIKTRAFTLLEIMVALGLLSVIVVAIYSSWHSIVKASKVGLDAAAASQRMRISMGTLQDSLLSACMFSENARYYAFLADSDGDFASLSFVARSPAHFCAAASSAIWSCAVSVSQ